jgi:hypothetical protein
LGVLLRRLGLWTVVMTALMLAPIPVGNETLGVHDGVLTVVFVLGIGKILYDTLFYDHFRP